MPSKSTKQQHFMGFCYGMHKQGKAPKQCPSMKVSREFATKKRRKP